MKHKGLPEFFNDEKLLDEIKRKFLFQSSDRKPDKKDREKMKDSRGSKEAEMLISQKKMNDHYKLQRYFFQFYSFFNQSCFMRFLMKEKFTGLEWLWILSSFHTYLKIISRELGHKIWCYLVVIRTTIFICHF